MFFKHIPHVISTFLHCLCPSIFCFYSLQLADNEYKSAKSEGRVISVF